MWKKVEGNTTYLAYTDEGYGAEIADTDAAPLIFHFRQGGPWSTNPVFRKQETTYSYYHNDHLGTPFKILATEGRTLRTREISAFGHTSGTGSIQDRLMFAGQIEDSELQQNYNYWRFYNDRVGRYSRSDPIGLGGGTNIYSFSNNNPGSFFDPYGLRAQNCNCDRERKDSAPWLGGGAGASGTAFVAGLSADISVIRNTDTGETCMLSTTCLKLGVGFGASASVQVELGFSGPYCGSELEGGTCKISYSAVSGYGVSGDITICDGFSVSVPIKPSVGLEWSLTYDICYVHVIKCVGRPCECA